MNKVDRGWVKTVPDVEGIAHYCQPGFPVSELFGQSWNANHVHFLVTAKELVQDGDSSPAIPVQPQPASTSLLDRFACMRITNDAPSVVAGIENYRSIQDNEEERIRDDRPHKDKLIAPISLLYQPFGYFRDVRYGVEVPGEERIHEGEFKEKVDALANQMSRLYDNEEKRRVPFIRHLERIFGLSPGSINSSKIPGSQKISDGHLNGAHGAMVICVECKNELSSASCEPVPRLTSYIATSFACQAEDEDYKELFRRWRVPALGVAHIGKLALYFPSTPPYSDVQDPPSNFLGLST